MATRHKIIASVIGGCLLLVVLSIWPTRDRRFAKYVSSAVPKSVHVVHFQNNDRLGINPEPVCYLSFTANAEDIATVIRKGGFRTVTEGDSVPVPPGPPGWLPANQSDPQQRVYTRPGLN